MREVFFLEANGTGTSIEGMKACRADGHRVHFVTRDPAEYESLGVRPQAYADEVSILDTFDVVRLLEFFADRSPAAILAFDDYRLLPAALAAQFKGLPHAPIRGLLNARYKDRCRTLVNGSAVGRPVTSHVFDLSRGVTEPPWGFPCVVKPVDDSGSVGVRICNSAREFEEAVSVLRQKRVNVRGYKLSDRVLVEEFIPGPEYSAEMLWDPAHLQWLLMGYTQKLVGPLPYCVEVGHIFPYSFGSLDVPIAEQLAGALASIQLEGMGAHVEFKVAQDKIIIMEINPRLGGDLITELVRLTTGTDMVKAYVDLHLGAPPARSAASSVHGAAAILFLTLPPGHPGGKITPPAEPSEGIVRSHIKSTAPKGLVSTDSYARLGYVIAVGDSSHEAEARARRFLDGVTIQGNIGYRS